MSNELSTPKVTICPADSFHTQAGTNFGNAGVGVPAGDFGNNRVSFFIGADAGETDPQMVLFGDMNIGTHAAAGSPASARFTTAQVISPAAIANANNGW